MNPVDENLENDSAFLKALGEFNKDSSKAINLQIAINEYRVGVAKTTLMGEHLLERSMLSDMVFAVVMNVRGDISNGDFKLFMTYSKSKVMMLPPQIVVYLSCTPEAAYDRMRSRNRAEESNVSIEYMSQLEEAHSFILPDLCEAMDIPMIEINYTNYGDPKDIAHSINAVRNTINAK